MKYDDYSGVPFDCLVSAEQCYIRDMWDAGTFYNIETRRVQDVGLAVTAWDGYRKSYVMYFVVPRIVDVTTLLLIGSDCALHCKDQMTDDYLDVLFTLESPTAGQDFAKTIVDLYPYKMGLVCMDANVGRGVRTAYEADRMWELPFVFLPQAEVNCG